MKSQKKITTMTNRDQKMKKLPHILQSTKLSKFCWIYSLFDISEQSSSEKRRKDEFQRQEQKNSIILRK